MTSDDFTYGMELEFGLLDRTIPPILGCKYSEQELDVASKHVTIDGHSFYSCSNPKDIHTPGGEINTPPTKTIAEQVEIFKGILAWQPQVNVNHRLHLHTHVAYPGISENLPLMKKILKYVQDNADWVLDNVYVPTKHPKMNTRAWVYQVVDQSKLPDYKYQFCMNATDPEDFRASHAKSRGGKPFFQFKVRYHVNLASIFKHGTIEFRHFFPTLLPEEIEGALLYSKRYVEEAMGDQKPVQDWFFQGDFFGRKPVFNIPKEVPFDLDLETYWQNHNFKEKHDGDNEAEAEDL